MAEFVGGRGIALVIPTHDGSATTTTTTVGLLDFIMYHTVGSHHESSDVDFLIEVAKVSAYFISLFWCLLVALGDLPQTSRPERIPQRLNIGPGRKLAMILLLLFAAANLVVTWRYIGQFMWRDRADHALLSIRDWMVQSDWFVKAYSSVTESPGQWLWSSSLLSLVATLTLFTYVEGHRCGLRGGSSIWLGCVAAISVSTPIFIAGLLNTTTATYVARLYVPANRFVLACVLTAVLIVTGMPYITQRSTFVAVLGLLHVVVALPGFVGQWLPGVVFRKRVAAAATPSTPTKSAAAKTIEAAAVANQSPTGLPAVARAAADRVTKTVSQANVLVAQRDLLKNAWLQWAYGALAGFGLVNHVHNLLALATETPGNAFFETLVAAFFANPCQASISYDSVATFGALAVYMLLDRHVARRTVFLLIIASPLASPAATFPLFLALREAAACRNYSVWLSNALAVSNATPRRASLVSGSASASSVGAAGEAITTSSGTASMRPAGSSGALAASSLPTSTVPSRVPTPQGRHVTSSVTGSPTST